MVMPPTSTMPIEFRATAPGRDKRQREVAGDGRDRGHQDGTQADARRLAHRLDLVHPLHLLRVGELDDEDAVLRDEPASVTSPTCE